MSPIKSKTEAGSLLPYRQTFQGKVQGSSGACFNRDVLEHAVGLEQRSGRSLNMIASSFPLPRRLTTPNSEISSDWKF
jgi:hypothetical protein